MPQAAAHILIPLFLVSFWRDRYLAKNKRNLFPLHYVLIAGIAGIIPDLDIVAFWALAFFGFTLEQIHRTFAHTIFIPFIFVIVGLIFHRTKVSLCTIRKHTLHLNKVMYALAFGTLAHLVLDALVSGMITPIYPISSWAIGLDLFGYLPSQLQELAAPSLDAGILIIWIIYLEVKHKISDF